MPPHPTPAFLPSQPLSPHTPSPFSRTPCRRSFPLCATDPPPTAKPNTNSSRRRRPKRKPSAFENTIDDLTMKRMGRGTIYYGKRASDQQQEDQVESIPEEDLLKPNPVLLAGGTGRTGQWIALGLTNQGFNVRCLTRAFNRAERIFGPSGSNLDVFQGDLASPSEVFEAVDGSIAIVCAAGAPWWLPGGFDSVDVKGVQNLVAAAKRAGTVNRFVLISSTDADSPRGRAKRKAEQIVKDSGLSYVIVRAPELRDEEGGLKKIALEPGDVSFPEDGAITRVDLAQCVCQALVYDRAVQQLREEDPEGDFDFPDCVVSVTNQDEPYRPDKRFWKKEFNRISDAYRDKADVADVENLSAA